jgi:uncharacterized protein DUF6220
MVAPPEVTLVMRSLARQALPLVGGLFTLCVIVQVFLAGLGVFSDGAAFETHRGFGYLIGMLTLVMLILALVGREPRRVIGLSALLLALFALQSVFVALRPTAPTVASLHPLNGFLILFVAITLSRAAWAVRRDAPVAAIAPVAPMAPAAPAEASR